MKRPKDAGLMYVQKLGVHPAKRMQDFVKVFERKYGYQASYDYLGTLDVLIDEGKIEEKYEFKNKDFEKSILYTGMFDAEFIRKVANWITQNKMFFGNKILDVGCDCGIMSCFLASVLPDSEITSIDKGTNAIVVARQLAEKMKLSNITFLQDNVKTADLGVFDTVISMRTLQENREECANPACWNIEEMCAHIRTEIVEYIKRLSELAGDAGNLIMIERSDIDPFFLAQLLELNENGRQIIKDTYQHIITDEVGEESHFQAGVYKRSEKQSKENVKAFWDSCFNIDPNAKEYKEWDADYVLEDLHDKKTIREIRVYDGERILGRFGLYEDGEKYYCYLNNGSGELHKMFVGDVKNQGEFQAALDKVVKDNRMWRVEDQKY